MFKHVLVPVDGSEHAARAVDIASDLVKHYGAKLTLIHILTRAGGDRVPEGLESYVDIENIRISEHDVIKSVGREILAKAKTRAREKGVTDCTTLLENGDPTQQIAQAVKNGGVDLIVMGRRGLGDLGGLLLGSVSHKVAQAVDCCCLTVK